MARIRKYAICSLHFIVAVIARNFAIHHTIGLYALGGAMAKIHNDVLSDHLVQYRGEREYLVPFLNGFDITWARRRSTKGTELSVYFLSPETHIKDQFGFEKEILLAISNYSTLQPRVMQAVSRILQEEPAQGRVDPTTFFLITSSPGAEDWVKGYSTENKEPRICVVFDLAEMRKEKNNQWLVRSIITRQLFSRDLFNEQLPLRSDLFFFGRDAIAAELLTSMKQAQNRGLFGLRKTGKTSLLYKVQRLAEREKIYTYYYDCKRPSIRNLHWEQFLERIIEDISRDAPSNVKIPKRLASHISDAFVQVVSAFAERGRVCLIFDEIEYVSPIAKLDDHWKTEFVPFWQTLWSAQSEIRELSFLLAGVNPTAIELDIVNDVQNPLFGIVTPKYLTGFDVTEVRAMLHHFGKRMGLKFDIDAVNYIFNRFGGHPLLTRMACSFLNGILLNKKVSRPYSVTQAVVMGHESDQEQEMSFYCRHVVSELKLFYPDEYLMLETLVTGNVAEFIELESGGDDVRHLQKYNLIQYTETGRPELQIPALARYIRQEKSRREGRRDDGYLVPSDFRTQWLSSRTRRIVDDFRNLVRLTTANAGPELFSGGVFPEAERFCELQPVSSRDQFDVFVNICNRCFVESVERTGRRIGKSKYFWNEIKTSYPELWEALHRIKLYRHEELHLELNANVDAALRGYLEVDLSGKRLSQLAEPYFKLQQAVIDELFVGLQCELDRLS